MPLKFYYSPMSSADVTRAVIAELEHGQSEPLAETVNVKITEGEAKTETFLSKVNPNGLVPVIVHDGVTIWESAAITIYLGETFGVDRKVEGVRTPLFPEAGTLRGEAMKWIVWPNLHLAAHTLPLHDGQPPEIKALESRSRADITKSLCVLNGALEGRDYLLGSEYTLADTHVWSFVGYMTMCKFELSKTPNVEAWFKRVSSRPQLKALK
ncbi:uncharacterized protein J7T54_000469 [Emericellopsis cladophorae]|uniref:Glutathione S-transferase n=1 Tax=Emericellopsis cladophorae TaxID=2686198 RepID=A0A9P9XXB5_9HYPO|nr:uncharacterized protein J7T54_000469 [Emericellopsis cladophorae]KAI6779371.1 hypothetical protein J7T54_000469 [Emericellopsis cladophorae]